MTELLKGFEGLTSSQSIDYQVNAWARGNPLHNPIRDECCPDFSCCGSPIWPEAERLELIAAHYDGDRTKVVSMTFAKGLCQILTQADIRDDVSIINPQKE
jgi:hypothetical protein